MDSVGGSESVINSSQYETEVEEEEAAERGHQTLAERETETERERE